MFSSDAFTPVASVIGFYFVLFASGDAYNQQIASQRTSLAGPHGLQSWTHEPMFVDEPRWVLLSQRTPGQSNTDEDFDDNFWVTRGRKRYLHSPRPPILFDRGLKLIFDLDEPEESLIGRGKKGALVNLLEKDPFWVNCGKKDEWNLPTQDSSLTALSNNLDRFPVHRGKRDVSHEVQDMLRHDPYWANRGKRGDVSSVLSNGDQFWVNRGKKDDLQSQLDKLLEDRGKKSELESALNVGDTFWVNRGKKDGLHSLLNNGEHFWVNRGKKSELESVLNSGDPFWVNRGKKGDVQSLLGDQFWVNRGKKKMIESSKDSGRFHGSSLKNYLFPESLFWSGNNRLKKDPIDSILKPDPFFVNRGKKGDPAKPEGNTNDTRSRQQEKRKKRQLSRKNATPLTTLLQGATYWLDRGKKTNNEGPETLDPFYVTRGKRMDVHNIHRRDVGRPDLSRPKQTAKFPKLTSEYEKDYPYKDNVVNSVILWWKAKPLEELQGVVEENDVEGRSPMINLGENIAQVEPFWVNRGKKDIFEDYEDVPDKRADADVQSIPVGDLGDLSKSGETLWVPTRG